MGNAAIEPTPNNLLGIIRNKLNVGKKYHSGKISRGVEKGSERSPIAVGSTKLIDKQDAIKPIIHTGNIYKRSFGQARSPK